ncbi:GGDEF domain-containing protein [Pengzhenrongella frigida]|uniref:GGDEF domain-containing protein n=1 Tax=Pengzhenrongella frigida TaxID=1259133 RepID=A0A4Q5N2J7_9MICO|nr:GGDEF domain-containing protein [Cellulomonas sp. HLT2-17]RYV52286.1 GGDEF domain-containing protein [Cellulomonas sp. HLT2-17]
MQRRTGWPASQPGVDLAGLARRVVALGIAVGAPIIAGTWYREGPQDPWVHWGYPPLGAVLLVFAWILLRRQEWAIRAALAILVLLEALWVVIALGRIAQAPDAATAWALLLPTPLLGVVVCLIVGFLFQSTRTALVHGTVYAALITAVIATALGQRPGGAFYVWQSLRYGVYLGVFLVLLLVLSRAKEHVTSAVADAARADATASRMRDMAYLDELTGIANRRRLLEELGHQAGLVSPSHPVCVVYFDLDHFKQVNDTFGHDLGDQVLRVVAEVAARTVRDGDVLARLGGEEFVLVTPATDHHQAVQLAERLRQALPQELTVAVGVRVTASFGVTELQHDESATSVLRRVDELMYRAKADGRDRVQSAGPAGPW